MIKSIAKKYINAINLSKYSKNHLIAVIGPMGSGKTTYITKEIIKKYPNHYNCSIDEYIEHFASLESDPRKLFKMCREVGIIVTDYLLDNNISMIIEGTGIHADTIEYFKRLKQAGYTIETHFLKTDMEICRQRVKERNEIKDNNHKVLDEDVVSYYGKLWLEPNPTHDLIKEVSDKVIYVYNYSKSSKTPASVWGSIFNNSFSNFKFPFSSNS